MPGGAAGWRHCSSASRSVGLEHKAGPLDHFRKAFEAAQPNLRGIFENVTDGEYWQQFIAVGDLVSATVTWQQPVSAHLARDASGQQAAAKIETTVKRPGGAP